ncbi:MAG: hypothetical protein HZB91_14505 [Elusimicrobia bacterium]|nr:hypothetical protein [Elusimicrobiota bacterium]
MKASAGFLLPLLLTLSGCSHQARLMSRAAEVKAVEDRHSQTKGPRRDLGESLGELYNDRLQRELTPGQSGALREA